MHHSKASHTLSQTKTMQYKNLIFNILIALLLCTHQSCDIINPAEEIPAYLTVESFTVGENPVVDELSFGANIVSANVLVDGSTVGVVSIPGTIPVFAEGDVTITLDPLVQANGANDILDIYPFWERLDIQVSLIRNDTTRLNPQTRYADNVVIRGSNFSGSDIFFAEDLDGNTSTAVTNSQTGGQPGEGSVGRIVLTPSDALFEAATFTEIDVSTASRVWLEVQYKTDASLLFGVQRENGDIFREYGVLPKGTWNTLYYDMRPLLLTQNIEKFKLTLSAAFPAGNSADEAVILIDNIKVVYL